MPDGQLERARLPVRPGGLCRRRLDGILPASYETQSPLGGGLRIWSQLLYAKSNTADALTAEHLSYCGDRGSTIVKAYYRRVLYRAWGLTAHRGWARLMLDRRSLVQATNAPRDQSQHPRARNDYDEETAYESYLNPEPGFQSGPGGSVDAD